MKASSLFLPALILATLASGGLAQTVNIVVTDGNVSETAPGELANPGNIRVTRTGSTASALTVWVKVSGVAGQGTDYTFGSTIGSFVTIPAGSASLNIPVTPIDDWLIEGVENLRVKLDTTTGNGAPVPYAIGPNDRADVDILDNEDPLLPPRAILTVAALDAQGSETTDGSDPASFRISRTNNLTAALDVLYTLGGTATAGSDYINPPATISIPAGVASADVLIAPINDTLVETPETVTFTLVPHPNTAVPPPPEAYVLGAGTTASVTIVSEDLPPQPTVAITAPGSNAAAPSGQPVTVRFTASAADGTIASYSVLIGGSTVASGVTNLPASTPAGTPFMGTASVTFTGSNGFAQLNVQVTNSNGVSSMSAPIFVYVYVASPPPPPPPILPVINIFPLDAEGAEVSAGAPNTASFRVTHNFPATSPVSFLFQMGGTAKEGVDYTLSSTGAIVGSFFGRWFTFPPGAAEAQVVVTPVDDLLIEGTETVTLSLYTPPFIGFSEGVNGGGTPPDWQSNFGFYYGTNPSASVNILDNDTTPPPFPVVTITATDPVGSETTDGSDPIVFTVTRTSGSTDVPLAVRYALTQPLRPYPVIFPTIPVVQNGADFPTLPGTVTIPAGASSVDIVVVPTYDRLAETDEALQITLRPALVALPDPAGYVIDDNIVATATIHDATLPAGTPVVRIVAKDTQAFEDNTFSRTASLYVARVGNLTDSLTVFYSISGTATNGVDYAALPGFVTIPAGIVGANIIIDPIADGVPEPPETVGITLQPPPLGVDPPPYVVGASLTMQRSAGVSIRDSRPPPAQLYVNRLLNGHFLVPRPGPPIATAATAAPPAIWKVEASTNLMDWEEIGTVESSETVDEFVDLNAGTFTQRFYRFSPATTP